MEGQADRSAAVATVSLPRRPRPPKRYRIGEIVEYCGLSRQTIHNYTTMGLICETGWTPGGHRLYDEVVFERLDRIADLKAVGKTIAQIRAALADDPDGDAPP